MKKLEMSVVHAHACGIDIGSRSHFVAVGQNDDQVKEFGISHSSHLEIVAYLNANQVETIAMESTGTPSRGATGKAFFLF